MLENWLLRRSCRLGELVATGSIVNNNPFDETESEACQSFCINKSIRVLQTLSHDILRYFCNIQFNLKQT